MASIVPELSPVQKLYSNASIFITGGTGFVGMALLEKLLRSCPDISTIYVLVRNKKGKNLHSRVDELFDDSIFDRMKAACPKFRHKIIGVGGDCSLPNLGLSMQDRQMLIDEVSIVFHVAATVRFDEKLKLAVAINVRAPMDMISLARQMTKLKVFMHVSTAFSYVPLRSIEERFYPSPVDSKKLILLSETMSDKILEYITPNLIEKWPNTYTFTKAVAEDVVRVEGRGLPVGVFRPSIVVSTYKEPERGWINNLYGPTGVCAGVGTGLLRALHAKPEVNANVVPVDMVVNAMILCAYEIATNFDKNAEIPIYHFESSNDKPINWGKFMHLSSTYGIQAPSIKAVWYYCFDLYRNIFTYTLATIFLHQIPAILVDGALLCMGKSPKMLKIYKKIHKFTGVIAYFSTRTWEFQSNNVRNIIDKMSRADRKMFFCDLRQLDWDEFFRMYCRGIRVHLLQDPMNTLAEATNRWRKLYWIHQIVKMVALFALLRLAWFFVKLFLPIF